MNSKAVMLIKFNKKSNLVERSIFRRGKKDYFSIEKYHSEGELITNKKPVRKSGIVTLSDYTFRVTAGGIEGLVFSESLSDKEKIKIRKAYKNECLWELNDFEFSGKSLVEISGPITVGKVGEISLRVHQVAVSIDRMFISDAEYRKFLKEGVSAERYADLVDDARHRLVFGAIPYENSTSFNGLVSRKDKKISLEVNGKKELVDLNKLLLNQAGSFEKKCGTRSSRSVERSKAGAAVIHVRSGNTECELKVYEKFDRAKLRVLLIRDSVPGLPDLLERYSVFYGDSEFANTGDFQPDWEETYVIDKKGKITLVSVLENVVDEEFEQDDLD